jgi:hypothetical protein
MSAASAVERSVKRAKGYARQWRDSGIPVRAWPPFLRDAERLAIELERLKAARGEGKR